MGGLVWLLCQLWPVLLVLIVALILVGTVSPWVEALERRGVSRGWSVAAVFIGFWGGTLALGLLAAPPLWKQLLHFIDDTPALQTSLAGQLSQNTLTAPVADTLRAFRLEKLLVGRRARDARDEKRYDKRSSGSSPEEAGALASAIATEERVLDAVEGVVESAEKTSDKKE